MFNFFPFSLCNFFCELRFVFQFSYNRCVWYSKAFGEVVVLQLQFTASECVDYRRRLSELNCCFRERLYLCSSNFLSPIAGFVLCLQLLVFSILLCVWNGVLDLKWKLRVKAMIIINSNSLNWGIQSYILYLNNNYSRLQLKTLLLAYCIPLLFLCFC